jgi:2-iminobutanoate/2-iminopropanoate deaminase
MADASGTALSPAVRPYSPVVAAGGWLVTSGQLGLVPDSDPPRLCDGSAPGQLRQALSNLEALLAEHGATLRQVVTATLFLRDMDDFSAVNDVWVECFGEHRPARTKVGVAELPMAAAVEVAAWAWVGAESA